MSSPRLPLWNPRGNAVADAASSRGRRGFTLIEMLIVILVIALLSAIAWPTTMIALRRSRVASTQQLVDALTASVMSKPERTVVLANGAVRHLWDFNNDGLIDGDPERDDTFTPSQRADAKQVNYRGLLVDLGIGVPKRNLDVATGRIRDPWGGWIRIGFAANRYGPAGVGIWSDGPDHQSGTDDDIKGWRTGP